MTRRKHTLLRCLLLLLVVCLAGAEGERAPEEEAKEAPKELTEEEKRLEEAQALVAQIDALEVEYRAHRKEFAAAEESDAKAVAELQSRRNLFEWMRLVERLARILIAEKEAGLDQSKFLQDIRKLLWRLDRRLPSFLDRTTEENAALRASLAEAPPEAIQGLELQVRGTEETLDEIVRFYLKHVQYMEALDLRSQRARTAATERLNRRAGELTARLEIAAGRVEEAESAGADSSKGGGDRESMLRDAQEQLDRLAASLWTTCEVMEALDLPTASYRQALFQATGEFTTDVLDTEVARGLATDLLEEVELWFERRGPVLVARFGLFLAILVGFWLAGRVARATVSRLVEGPNSQMSQLAKNLIVGTTSRIVLIFGFFFALSQVGVNVTALLTGLGIIGFIIGFALQDTLGNFASGAMILIYHPFDVGDVIEAAGVTGTVDHMNLVSTAILTFDNQKLVVPNSRIWGDVIRNATALDKRRVDLSFPLALDVDVDAATRTFEEMCREHPAVLDDPKPAIEVQSVTSEGVLFIVRPWVATSDYWPTFWALNREAHSRLEKAGFRIATTRYEIAAPEAR